MNVTTKIALWVLLCYPITKTTAQDHPNAPDNPWLADSPWPTYHKNSARQSYSDYAGPTEEDSVVVKVLKNIKGGTSPWTYFSEAYEDGERVMLQSNATHYVKLRDSESGPEVVSKLRIDDDWLKSFNYTQLQIKGNQWYAFDPKENPRKGLHTKLFKIGDKHPNDPNSPLQVKKVLDFGALGIGKTQHAGVNYLGQIVFASDNEKGKKSCTVGIISQDLELLASMDIAPIANNEIFGHNGFPIDEHNNFYLVTTHRLIRVDWDNENLSIGFEAKYDFVKDGPTGRWAEGSGTTPTLMGFGEGNDQLIVMADGHAKNNFVGFWRKIPDGWQGLPGEDTRLAGRIQLPSARTFSKKFQSIENSPTVYGYEAAIAQYNGFLGQGDKPVKGVQKVRWDTDNDSFEISWVNTDVNLNGVLTYSVGSDMVYGSGRENNCNYFYYGLDWATGELRFRKHLGRSCKRLFNPYDDPGDQNIIDEDGNIFFAGGGSLVKLEIVRPSDQPAPIRVTPMPSLPREEGLNQSVLYPNPSHDFIELPAHLADTGVKSYVTNTTGQILIESTDRKLYVGDLSPGVYLLKSGTSTIRFSKE